MALDPKREKTDPETLMRNRRTRGLKKFTAHTKTNVLDDSPPNPSTVPLYQRAPLISEEKRKAQVANRQI